MVYDAMFRIACSLGESIACYHTQFMSAATDPAGDHAGGPKLQGRCHDHLGTTKPCALLSFATPFATRLGRRAAALEILDRADSLVAVLGELRQFLFLLPNQIHSIERLILCSRFQKLRCLGDDLVQVGFSLLALVPSWLQAAAAWLSPMRPILSFKLLCTFFNCGNTLAAECCRNLAVIFLPLCCDARLPCLRLFPPGSMGLFFCAPERQ